MSSKETTYMVELSFNISKMIKLSAYTIGAFASVYFAYYAGYKLASKPMSGRKARETKDNDEIEDIVGRLRLNDDTLREVMRIIEEEMIKGNEGEESSELMMLPVYVNRLPKSFLNGKYLALDLGGTNFRIAEVNFRDDGNIEEQSKVYVIPDRIIMDEGTELFAYVATCLGGFMRIRNLAYRKSKLPVAFCFSFPCRYADIRNATLIHWVKGFKCKNTCGKNVGEMLQNAMDSNPETKAELKAVVNDTVSCMMACAYKQRNCLIGAIFGSGINVCYFEDTEKLKTLQSDSHKKNTMINVKNSIAISEFVINTNFAIQT
ncbi:hypothetical protein GJ496_002331 [Pomphorhynchus laevis]|nr:hypothetical protein GJ496_002331 [Pomphorhynchus laevis]